MKQHTIFTTFAAVAVALSAPALAKPGGGGGGGQGQGHGNAGAPIGGGHGQGQGNAGAGGMDNGSGMSGGLNRSGANDGVASMGMGQNKLTGVVDGMTVVDSSGATIGTVTDINTRGNGSVRNVEVTRTDGTVVTLKSKGLSLDGDVLTTTTVQGQAANRRVNSQGPANANINGLVNASPNSVLAGAGVTTLTGLATGLTVNNSGGTAIGTVTQIFTNRAGAVVGINVDLAGDGDIVFIPATTLSMDGTTVVTTSTSF